MMARETIAMARIIRNHYGLKRPVTPVEVLAEINSLLRKHKAGTMDDSDEMLAARLHHLTPIR